MAARQAFHALTLTAVLPAMLVASGPASAGTVTQTNLTSDGTVAATVTDPNLKNPWGISYAPGGAFWVSDNGTGLTTLYNGSGAIQALVVAVPAAGGSGTGTPTGQVFNPTTDFVVTAGGKSGAATFIFATEDGTISGWNFSVNPATAIVAVDRSAQHASYKGVAMVANAGKNFLLATDFHNGTVDVFDATYTRVSSFRDTTLSKLYSPYNVAVLNGSIYVTYARVDRARHDSVSGNGKGAIEKVSFSGQVQARYLHGQLNAPWGLALAPAGWGKRAGDILVGNFGNGWIPTFTPALKPEGVLKGPGAVPIAIDGLWGLIPGNGGTGGDTSKIYFTAGPNDEANGLFGSLSFSP
ncbi:MAG: TIGR03118 family protein [Rhodospirillales bacterium]